MSMTLEESIARCEKIVKEAKKSYEVPVADGIMAEVGMELTKKGIEEYQQYTEWLSELQERRKQPEIVRCKDCENWDTTWQNDFASNYHYCPMMDGSYSGDFYCAKAERRNDATN